MALMDFLQKHRKYVDLSALGAACLLGTAGFTLMAGVAYLKHDWFLGSMVIAAIVLLIVALIPAYCMYKLTHRLVK